MDSHNKLLKDLAAAGCRYTISVPSVSGTHTETITPDQALRLLSDKDSVYAELAGVSVADYLEWRARMGSVQCRAMTRAGVRCKHAVVGAVGFEPLQWVAVNDGGGYCQVHGG